MRIHVVLLFASVTLAAGCVGGGRTTGTSHPASSSAAITPLPAVARAVTHEDDATAPAGAHDAHAGHGVHAGHGSPTTAEHAHD